MNLHQLQAAYHPDEDRILLRTSFIHEDETLQEIRLWLTRRLIKELWPSIITAMETQVEIDMPHAAHAKAEMVSMAYESSIDEIRSRGDFDQPFAGNAEHFPLGEEPTLVQSTHITVQAAQQPRVTFVTQGGSIEIAFNASMLHGFCTLLQEAVEHADWDMSLALGDLSDLGDPPSRLLN